MFFDEKYFLYTVKYDTTFTWYKILISTLLSVEYRGWCSSYIIQVWIDIAHTPGPGP